MDETSPLFVISVAAQLAGMHPQTLRTYDRMGLVSPRRTRGRGRRYSRRDVARLELQAAEGISAGRHMLHSKPVKPEPLVKPKKKTLADEEEEESA